MTLTELGAVGEFVGAIGVVITLMGDSRRNPGQTHSGHERRDLVLAELRTQLSGKFPKRSQPDSW